MYFHLPFYKTVTVSFLLHFQSITFDCSTVAVMQKPLIVHLTAGWNFKVTHQQGKSKVSPRIGHDEGPKGDRGMALFFILSARWRWVVNATSRPLYPRERDSVPTVQESGWLSATAGLDGCGKYCPTGFDPRTTQPVASRYIDWTTPAHISTRGCFKIIKQS